MAEYTDKTTENFIINKMDIGRFKQLESEGKLSDTELYFVDGMAYSNVWVGTQAQYDALETKDPEIYYITTIGDGKYYSTYTRAEVDTLFVAKKDYNVPTKVSQLENDAGYISDAEIPTKTSDLINDSGFITSATIPTKVSDLQNDTGFITRDAKATTTDFGTVKLEFDATTNTLNIIN